MKNTQKYFILLLMLILLVPSKVTIYDNTLKSVVQEINSKTVLSY